jgi:redox-sensitive bicupin YhaK (pirin superfamily)
MAIEQIIKPQASSIAGIPIRRVLPARERLMVGPFIFMDQGGPLTMPNRPGMGVPEHPHAGLSTFTYLMAGHGAHVDSAGFRATIQAGDIALMTAGRGITHEEMPATVDAPTRDVYFAQMWLALPDAVEEMEPTFQQHARADLPVFAGDKATGRVAMGTYWGLTAPTTCHAPTLFADIELQRGGSIPLASGYDEQALFLMEGDATLGDAPIRLHDLNLLAPTEGVLRSEGGGRALLFGGAHFPSKRWIGGSFVASSPDKLRRWMRNSALGRWPRIQR